MTMVPACENEQQRLAALERYAILDSEPEQVYDDITRLASLICGTPIALVSLVDRDRQWFKSRVGLDVADTPRADSFCVHTFSSRDVMVVPDALEDVRFVENPLVLSGPRIRFYAGVPLVTPDKFALGALCIIDTVPRTLSEEQKESLRGLGRQVMAQLELRRQLAEQKSLTDACRLSEEQFSSAFEHAPIGMALVSPGGRWLKVNRSVCSLLGFTADELMAKTFQELTHADDLETDLEHVRRVLAGEIQTYQLEKRYWHKSGQVVWALLSVSLVRTDKGEPLYFISQIKDITERRRTQEQMVETTLFLQTIVDHAAHALIATDPEGLITRFNPAAERLLGYSAGEMIGRQTPAVFHDPVEVASRVEPLNRELGISIEPGFEVFVARARRGLPEENEWTYVRKDGSRIPVQLSISALENRSGEITGFLGIAQDISARKQAEEKFRVLFDQSSDAHLLFDDTGIIDCNDAAIRMLRCHDRREVLSLHPAELSPEFQPDGRRSLEKCIEMDRLARQKGFHRFDWIHRRTDGEDFPVEVSLTPVTLNEKPALLVVWHEIGDRKRHEEELLRLKDAAEASSRAKSEFLAMMSHEIRTPMNGVLGFSDLLLETRLDSEQKEYVDTIRRSGQNLLTLINDILDFSKIESGRMDIESIAFHPLEVCAEVVTLLKPRAEEKGIGLSLTVASGLEDRMIGDPTRMRQVLINLVGNAIKFTTWGSVSIIVQPAAADGWKFSVVDSGPGIPEDKQGQLFQKFSQADSSTTRKFGGTGLGLAICKRLVELMGGRIGLLSEHGKGSTFWFTLPAGLASPTPAEVLSQAPVVVGSDGSGIPGDGPPIKVLLVEDNVTNQSLAKQLLRRLNCRVDVASNGDEAVSLAGGPAYDVILMDCQMPQKDGFEATAEIRRSNSANRNVPIIALTANAMESDRDRCLAAGMDDFLSKPFSPEDLRGAVKRWTGRISGSGTV